MSELTILAKGLTGAEPPLSFEERFLIDRELCRGASPDDLIRTVVQLREKARSRRRVLETPAAPEPWLVEDELRRVILPRWKALRAVADREFGEFTDHVRTALQGSYDDYRTWAPKSVIKDLRELRDYYWHLRGAYCRDGKKPAELFVKDKLRSPADLLGIHITHGARIEVIEKLRQLKSLLNEHQQSSIRAEVEQVMGFQPRFVHGTQKLSNHAFGMAIDIDPNSNPHILRGETANILQAVIREAGDVDADFDFGQRLVPPTVGKDGKKKTFDYDALYQRAKRASDVIQQWLTRTYELRGEVKNATRQVAAAELALAKAREGSAPTEELDRLQAELAQLRGALEQLQGGTAREHLRRLASLERLQTPMRVRIWASKGIVTVPLTLVLALQKLGFVWGMEWEHSKDIMHFELPISELK